MDLWSDLAGVVVGLLNALISIVSVCIVIFFKKKIFLQVNIADFQDNQWLTCFQETGEVILGQNTAYLGELKEKVSRLVASSLSDEPPRPFRSLCALIFTRGSRRWLLWLQLYYKICKVFSGRLTRAKSLGGVCVCVTNL